MTPKWPDFVLAADVPHSEADVLVLHRLHVEAWSQKNVVSCSVRGVVWHVTKTRIGEGLEVVAHQ